MSDDLWKWFAVHRGVETEDGRTIVEDLVNPFGWDGYETAQELIADAPKVKAERDRLFVDLSLAKAALDEVTDRLELTRLERDEWKDTAHKLKDVIERFKLAANTPDADEESGG